MWNRGDVLGGGLFGLLLLAVTLSGCSERDESYYLPDLDPATRQPLLDLLDRAGRKVGEYGGTTWPGPPPIRIAAVEIYELRRR